MTSATLAAAGVEGASAEQAQAPVKKTHHYRVLDSWRGICAMMVVLFHFDVYSHAYNWGLIRNGTHYVDFFFVLSGFVISINYLGRLRAGFGFKNFMVLRAGRIYPLHLFMLVVFVLFELAFADLISKYSVTSREAFTGSNGIPELIANVFLVQSMNVFDYGTWNLPSWSISVEFYTYLIFALVIFAFGAFVRSALVILTGVLISLFFLIDGLTMGAAYEWGILRSLYGFCVGSLLHVFIEAFEEVPAWFSRRSRLAATILEILAVVLAGLFISVSYPEWPLRPLLPLVFGLVLFVFLSERGWISALLKMKPFLFLGTLSYSIYLVHYFLLLRLKNAGQLAEKMLDVPLFTVFDSADGPVKGLGTQLWHGDLAYVAIALVVIIPSYLTWRFIEKPGQTYSKALVKRWRGTNAPIPDVKAR